MKKGIVFIIAGIILIGLIVLVMAVEFTPQGNINLRNIYNITEAPIISATILNATNLTVLNVIASANAYIGSGTEWLSIYLSGSIGYFNSTYPIVFTNNVSFNNYYGEMWMHNASGYATTAIASSNVWYNLTGFNATDMITGQSLNGFTYDDANEHLTALIAGKYKAMYSVSTGNAGNNQEYEFVVVINGIIQNNTVTHRKLAAAGDVGNAAGSGLISILVDDNIYLMTANKDGTADIQTHSMNLNLIRIGN